MSKPPFLFNSFYTMGGGAVSSGFYNGVINQSLRLNSTDSV